MDPKKVLSLVYENGKAILESGGTLSGVYKSWYFQAETGLQQALGDDWKDKVNWQVNKYIPESYLDIGNLEHTLSEIQTAITFCKQFLVK